MANRQYLELMGIEVWQKRRPRTALVAVDQSSVNPISSPAPATGIADLKRSLGVPEQTSVSGPNTAPTQSADLDSVTGSLAVKQTSEAETGVTETSPDAVADINSPEAAPEFLLTFSHFGQVTMVNYYPVDFASIPGNHQRFLATFNRALSRQKEAAQVTEFRWPMVKSSRISQSKEEARQVLGRHFEQCRPNVLIYGANAAEMLGVDDIENYSEGVVRDRRVTIVSDIELYFRTPSHRRDLWLHSKQLRDRCHVAS